ncbi:sensor histidine kinase [Pseudoduganella umbonata]|uniref:histidine kinase n=1 Tax=Pseudoduganella umbonata TaxID=864828 RepID=A0A4V1EDL2_9BURK|nr:HAMP domain-containing sensor histidine kinase [Pseudoduganella umbonata]MBB3225056.1 two-component system CAI-1 autoinducer sensor kinase/phosphatase CqsS [Pseudoduganella umbonata]QCP11471.1 HAMP domain-containing histidine kinase [Pseudoduganella umbonata]
MGHDAFERAAGGFIGRLARRHRGGERAAIQAFVLGWLSLVLHPLYFVVFTWVFPQPYESPALRLLGTAVGAAGIVAARYRTRWCELYVPVALTFVLPFFGSYMFMMNGASSAWTQCLTVMIVGLFHFPTGLALRCYAGGIALACLCVVLQDNGGVILSQGVLEQLPVHAMIVLLLGLARFSRVALEQEKMAGLGEGLGAVAHEMRTPLAAMEANVRGLTRMLQALPAGQPDELRHALGRVQYEVRHMNHLIDLFLLSANAVRRRHEPFETVSMADAVQAVLRRYPFTSQEQSETVTVEVRGNFRFSGQHELTVVILLNLLRNALKAIHRAGKGRVRIVVDGNRKVPRLLFIDTACGIAARRLPLIFQRFYAYPAHNGTGIGLALCRQIMRAWHAEIRCLSREHAYSIFVLEFPVQRSTPPSGAP